MIRDYRDMLARGMDVTRETIIAMLKKEVRDAGSQKKAAFNLGITDQYLSDVMRGYRPAGPKILTALKLESVKIYRTKL